MIDKKLDLPEDHREYLNILIKGMIDTNQDQLLQISFEEQYLIRITRLNHTYNMDKYFDIYNNFKQGKPFEYDPL